MTYSNNPALHLGAARLSPLRTLIGCDLYSAVDDPRFNLTAGVAVVAAALGVGSKLRDEESKDHHAATALASGGRGARNGSGASG